MNNLLKEDETKSTNNNLPDIILKALIAEKSREIQEEINENAKLDEFLKEKKQEYELRKFKTEAKQKEYLYWKEKLKREEAEIENIKFELTLIKADLSPKCKEMIQEEKDEEEYCNKVKIMWESYKDQWESKPLAIEKKNAYAKLKLAKIELTLLQNKICYQKQINKIQQKINYERLQNAIIAFAKVSVERRTLQDELESINEYNEELKTNLGLLKSENESHSSTKSIDTCFLMPPPSLLFQGNVKYSTDSVSVYSMAWEDMLLSENDYEQTRQASHLQQSSTAQVSRNKSIIECIPRKNSSSLGIEIDDSKLNSEQDFPLSQQGSQDMSTQPLTEKLNSTNFTEMNVQFEEQECSSTVNDNLERASITSPPKMISMRESEKTNNFQTNMDYAISIKSNSFVNNICACSSSTVFDYETKKGSNADIYFECSSLDMVNKNESLKSVINDEESKQKDNFVNEASKNVPIVKSVEDVTHKFQFFRNSNPDMNMFSTQFTMQSQVQEKSTTKETEANDKISNEMEYTEYSDGDFDIRKMKGRAFSPISDMETDFDVPTSLTSDVTFSKMRGNISPLSFDNDGNKFKKSQRPANFIKENQNEKDKEPKPSLYSNIQMTNFLGQSETADFFKTDKKTSLF